MSHSGSVRFTTVCNQRKYDCVTSDLSEMTMNKTFLKSRSIVILFDWRKQKFIFRFLGHRPKE